MKKNPRRLTYKTSGVDIDKANIFIEKISPAVKSTLMGAVLRNKGAFGSLFALDVKDYREPVLVSSTDGVGTKLLLAKALNRHDTVGIDLVAMNVNDILCSGAKPLFFLDYIACGRLDVPVLKDVVEGIAKGCRIAGCSLVGGETAEMPDLYRKDDYDLAGFAVGVAERSRLIDGHEIRPGDRMIGLASSGLHSNGFSLVRKALSPSRQKKLARELLEPTRIYVAEILDLLGHFPVKGIAHITGGAFYEKLTKLLPPGQCFRVNKGSWPIPEIFAVIQKSGRIEEAEMFRTFNMGIGMVLVVDPQQGTGALKHLERLGMKAYAIGEVVSDANRKVVL